jgi:hypothetical protein
MKQGCSNNIQKNGNKIWYVLHNLVENMSSGKLSDVECDTMRLTIRTIISSIPCVECKLHSISWLNEKLVNNTILDFREKWIYELWRHHDSVNKKVLLLNPFYKLKPLSWVEYKKQIEIDRITCKSLYNDV